MGTVKVRLGDAETRQLDRLAARLQMEREEAARWLLRAAIEALESERRFEWPIHLIPKTPS